MRRSLLRRRKNRVKPGVNYKLGTTRETLQEYRLLRHGRIGIQLNRLGICDPKVKIKFKT